MLFCSVAVRSRSKFSAKAAEEAARPFVPIHLKFKYTDVGEAKEWTDAGEGAGGPDLGRECHERARSFPDCRLSFYLATRGKPRRLVRCELAYYPYREGEETHPCELARSAPFLPA